MLRAVLRLSLQVVAAPADAGTASAAAVATAAT